jgi:hypothetical protein
MRPSLDSYGKYGLLWRDVNTNMLNDLAAPLEFDSPNAEALGQRQFKVLKNLGALFREAA